MPKIERQSVQENVQESDAPERALTLTKLSHAPGLVRFTERARYSAIEHAVRNIAKRYSISKKQVVYVMAFSSEPQARELYQAYADSQRLGKQSVMLIARKLGLNGPDIVKFFRQGYKAYQTLDYDIRGMKRLPEIGDGLFESAVPKDVPCGNCRGTGKEVKGTSPCKICAGSGFTREPANLKRVELALRSLGVVKEAEQNINVAVPVTVTTGESLESLIRKRDQVIYGKVVESVASPSDEDKQ